MGVMADEPGRGFIQPPPGLLPPAPPLPAPEPPVHTDSATVRMPPGRVVPAPALPTVPGAPGTESAAPAPGADEAPPTAPTPTVAGWRVVLPDGSARTVPAGGLALGRNPSAPEGWPDAESLAVSDPEKSVSKTHALLVPAGEELHVVDLASTNGVELIGPDGSRSPVTPNAPTAVRAGSTVLLGGFGVRVDRG